MTAIQDEVDALILTLGSDPEGVYADVRVRLDILESRINNPFVPVYTIAPSDGYLIKWNDGYAEWQPFLPYPVEIDLFKGVSTDDTGVATSIGSAYINTSLWAETRIVKFRCILESTDATSTYAATIDLYDTSGALGTPSVVSGSQIDNTGATSPLVASMVETTITAAFASAITGVFEVRLWIANAGGSNIVTCKSAQLIIEG